MVLRAAWGLATLLGLASPALAGDCRLALALALDVSSSVGNDDHRLQREGLAGALLSPEVVRAFLSGDPVALFIFEWNSPSTQAPLLPGWQLIRSQEDLSQIAASVSAHPRSGLGDAHHSTAVGTALSFAASAFQEVPDCPARTINISGDGVSNDGISPAFAHYPFEGVTVNALVIDEAKDDGAPPGEGAELVTWFETQVLHGPEAFLVLADGYEDFERAMRIKLSRELKLPLVSGLLLAGAGLG